MNPNNVDQKKLREMIQDSFDPNDLITLCFDLRIVYANIAGSEVTHPVRIVALIKYCIKNGRFDDLFDYLCDQRPHIKWTEIVYPPPPPPPTREVKELMVAVNDKRENFDQRKQEAIISITAIILGIRIFDITLKSIESGSVLLRFEVPADSIYRLKDISENDKKKLAAHKVTSIGNPSDSQIGMIIIPSVGWLPELIDWFKNLPKWKKIAFGLTLLVTIALVIFVVSTSGIFSLTNVTPTAAIAEVKTETPSPTMASEETPTSTPTPIKCSDSDIVLGIFPQLAQELTTSFVGVSNATIDCDGVYDVFNSKPLAVKIKYEAVPRSFAYFGISIPEGFDVSDYNEICVWVYTEESNQEFDLKLEDANGGKGVRIHTTKTSEWEEHCVMLSGYTGIDLQNLTTISLSFNDNFGSVAIWVDDFELK